MVGVVPAGVGITVTRSITLRSASAIVEVASYQLG